MFLRSFEDRGMSWEGRKRECEEGKVSGSLSLCACVRGFSGGYLVFEATLYLYHFLVHYLSREGKMDMHCCIDCNGSGSDTPKVFKIRAFCEVIQFSLPQKSSWG